MARGGRQAQPPKSHCGVLTRMDGETESNTEVICDGKAAVVRAGWRDGGAGGRVDGGPPCAAHAGVLCAIGIERRRLSPTTPCVYCELCACRSDRCALTSVAIGIVHRERPDARSHLAPTPSRL